jgi:hypothetical protein
MNNRYVFVALLILLLVLFISNVVLVRNSRLASAFGITSGSCSDEEYEKYKAGSEELASLLAQDYAFVQIDDPDIEAPLQVSTSQEDIWLQGDYKGYKDLRVRIRYSVKADSEERACIWQTYVYNQKRSLSWMIEEEEATVDEFVFVINEWYLTYTDANELE